MHLWWAGLNETGVPPLDLCDERIEIHMFEEFPVQGPYRGHEGVRRYVHDIFEVTEDFHVDVDEVVPTGDEDRLVTVQRVVGRTRHTRLEVDFAWATVWTIEDGRILRAQGYATRAEALQAAGLPQ